MIAELLLAGAGPWIGLFIGFMGTALVGSVVLAVTGSKRWHDRRHGDAWRLMCDHCVAERRYLRWQR